MLVGCMPALIVKPTSAAHYPASASIELLRENDTPRAAYIAIAKFRGSEQKQCPAADPYCSVMAHARRLGANAVWIQHTEVQSYPGEWKEIRGQLTQIRGFSTQIIEGVMLRYTDPID